MCQVLFSVFTAAAHGEEHRQFQSQLLLPLSSDFAFISSFSVSLPLSRHNSQTRCRLSWVGLWLAGWLAAPLFCQWMAKRKRRKSREESVGMLLQLCRGGGRGEDCTWAHILLLFSLSRCTWHCRVLAVVGGSFPESRRRLMKNPTWASDQRDKRRRRHISDNNESPARGGLLSSCHPIPSYSFRPVGRLLGLPKIPKAHGGIRMDYVKIALLSINSLFVALAIVICKTNVINLWKYNTIRRKKYSPRPPAAFHPSTPKSTARIKRKVDKETFTRCCKAPFGLLRLLLSL